MYRIAVLGVSRASVRHFCPKGLGASLGRMYSPSCIVLEKFVQKVPPLGESITEGSISSWTKRVGEAVAVDDCVVIIETDKVSVEIKSTQKGVLTRQIGDGDIKVGDDIFEVDTEGAAVAAPSAAPKAAVESPKMAPAAAPKAAPAAAHAESASRGAGHRTPLIKFTHVKREASATAPTAPVKAPAAAAPQPQVAPGKAVKDGKGVDFRTLPGGAWFGRPQLSAVEIAAIESGGASIF
jgi:pyruvate/2-oxoglutarate dehydrogenase complex dihydrolipoamide acyltransferase (E2) component